MGHADAGGAGDVLAAHRAEVTALQARLDAATQRSKDRGRVERARFARLISGWWQASGTDSDGHGADELLFLEAKADGSLGGIVDDGDGVVGDDDCVYMRRIDEVAQTISLEMGAPLWLSRAAQASTGCSMRSPSNGMANPSV